MRRIIVDEHAFDFFGGDVRPIISIHYFEVKFQMYLPNWKKIRPHNFIRLCM